MTTGVDNLNITNLEITDVIIIGGGLIGCMTSKYFKKMGLETIIIDSNEKWAASKCSFGVWKDTWVNEKIKDFVHEGYDYLYEVCDGFETVPFYDMKKQVMVDMYRVDCKKILNEVIMKGSVLRLDNDVVTCLVNNEALIVKARKMVIVAAGAYTDDLLIKSDYLNIHNIDSYWGATLNINMNINENRLYEWAPYKQCVLLKTSNKEFVFGDGASVKNPTSQDKRIDLVSNRLLDHLNEVAGLININDVTGVNEGLRPYLKKGDSAFIKQHDKKLFSATGGAKSTTILCSYIAQKLFDEFKML